MSHAVARRGRILCSACQEARDDNGSVMEQRKKKRSNRLQEAGDVVKNETDSGIEPCANTPHRRALRVHLAEIDLRNNASGRPCCPGTGTHILTGRHPDPGKTD